VARATVEALKQLNNAYELAEARGKDLEQVLPFWMRGKQSGGE